MSVSTFTIAQHQTLRQLRQQWHDQRVPHALLLAGDEGVGKLAIALDLARILLCENQDTLRQQATTNPDLLDNLKPCGECRSCRMATALAHPDLHFVFPVIKPKGSNSAISDHWLPQWRQLLSQGAYFDLAQWENAMDIENQQPHIYAEESDELSRKLALSSSQGGHKVVIVWHAELMNETCANKLLKLLEEPPTQTIFILTASQPERLLATILSRTQRIDVPPLAHADIAEALRTQRGLSESDATHVAHVAAGSYTQALRQLSATNDEREFFDMFVLLMRKCYQRDIREMHAWAEQVAAWGRERQKAFLTYALRLVRENFVYNFHRPELNFMNRSESEFATKFARFINERNVIPISDEISDALRDIEQNVHPKMVFFDFALKMIVLLIQ